MNQVFATIRPIWSRQGLAFVLHTTGLWFGIIGGAIAAYTLLYSTQLQYVSFVGPATQSAGVVLSAEPLLDFWLHGTLLIYLAIGLTFLTVAALLMVLGHAVRSRRRELEVLQSHQEEL